MTNDANTSINYDRKGTVFFSFVIGARVHWAYCYLVKDLTAKS